MDDIVIREENLCLTSDIHLGNPFFGQSQSFMSFLDYLCDNNMNLCINGDGIDILQLSFAGISLDLPDIVEHMEAIASRNLKIYYVIGNHDIYLEKFLNRWKSFVIVPFLDVVSGGKRIHIEHGHLYDDFFLKHPVAYTKLTVFVGYFLKVAPGLYKLWDKAYSWLLGLPDMIKRSTPEEKSVDRQQLIDGAKELLQRGYDMVIFGHSHCTAQLLLGEGQYFNTGSWLRHPNHFIEIKKGVAELKTWE